MAAHLQMFNAVLCIRIRIRMFLSPGFGFVIILYGSGFGSGSGSGSINKQKVRKTLISTILQLPFDFLSMKTDVKTLKKKNLFFGGILSATDEKSRIRIWICKSGTDPRIQFGSVPKCHGSTTLVNDYSPRHHLPISQLVF